ncbi:hypothetical protein SAMN06295900_104427 [Trinickia caryophylli]|uniref:Uncharacterized protein n=2 Tax=Trinickia caryophylli TaxID=28094 RepID=A0A1X7E399_TRICW|nr:hypothetical protein SAMN06295900_104427 [Trinickia caryophylli]
MQMQQSLVSMNKGLGQLRLSGPLSEWLFASKFWSDLNAKQGTMFDQFEEDEADVPIIRVVVEELERRVRALRELGEHDVEFVYRWTAEHKPLTTSVPRESLLSEVVMLRDFLADAVAQNCPVTFAL